MEDKQEVARKLKAKLYVLHDHLRRYDPSAPDEGPAGDTFIRMNDLVPLLQEIGYDVASPQMSDEEVDEAFEEVGHTYCLSNDGEPEINGDPKAN